MNFNIENENIFIVGSCYGKNTQVLADKIYLATTRTLDLLMQKTEGKMLLKVASARIFKLSHSRHRWWQY
jgi:hypothetical protein